MRKRNCDKLFDNIFWYLVYLYPIIISLIQSIHVFENYTPDVGLVQTTVGKLLYENLVALGSANSGFIIDIFVSIFGRNGIMSLTTSNAIFMYIQYVVMMFMVHLLFDFIMFIPRLCHKPWHF